MNTLGLSLKPNTLSTTLETWTPCVTDKPLTLHRLYLSHSFWSRRWNAAPYETEIALSQTFIYACSPPLSIFIPVHFCEAVIACCGGLNYSVDFSSMKPASLFRLFPHKCWDILQNTWNFLLVPPGFHSHWSILSFKHQRYHMKLIRNKFCHMLHDVTQWDLPLGPLWGQCVHSVWCKL